MNIQLRKILINGCRFLFAVIFIFSGFVKLVDPLGFTYKIEDYLTAFGPFFETFSFLAFPASVLLASIEFLIGINLLLGIYRKYTAILAVMFMAVMLPLTLYIAIFNPVADCGCFGDALIIDNWSTFYKNIILSIIAVLLFYFRGDIIPFISHKYRWIATAYVFLFSILLSVYCYLNLPIIDFRPYKIGTYIPEQMEKPEDAPDDEYDTKLIYEKDGVQQEFSIENYPANDPEWKFISSESKLIRKGYEPPIHDFSITLTDTGDDITEEVLQSPDYTFLLISYKLEKASMKDPENINEVYNYATQNGYRFYCLNASLENEQEDYVKRTDAQYPLAITDGTTLKTIIRSNPGLLLLKDGTIINKWHYRNIPTFNEPLEKSEWGIAPKPTATKNTLAAAVILFLPLFLIIVLNRKKNEK